jgi:hypothetical protein
MLLDEIAHSVRCMSCVLDGEIVCRACTGARRSISCCSGALAAVTSSERIVPPEKADHVALRRAPLNR